MSHYKKIKDGGAMIVKKYKCSDFKKKVGIHKISCCDCGLVHELIIENGRSELTFHVTRNERATAQKRRNTKYMCRPSK